MHIPVSLVEALRLGTPLAVEVPASTTAALRQQNERLAV